MTETTEPIPYDEIDPAVRELCRAINEFTGIATSDSCQGFVDDHRPGEPWSVFFRPIGLPTVEAYTSLEFLAHLCNGGPGPAAGFDVYLHVNAPPPYLNGPAETMYWFIECSKGHPDDFADLVRGRRERMYVTRAEWDASDDA